MSRHRKEFKAAVRKARLEHCKKNGIPHCEGCGKAMVQGEWAFDHDKADGLGGDPTFENCRVLCNRGKTSCHSRKTELHDKPLMVKADAIRNQHNGTAKIKARIPSPPKVKRESRRLADTLPQLPRQSLFK